MGKEINLLKNYPVTNRNVDKRGLEKTEQNRKIARKFGKDFFDGDRKYGDGGFNYNPKFWQPVIPTFIDHWSLNNKSKVLDVGCGKGFMLYDLHLAMPEIDIKGIDISEYAINNSISTIKKNLQVANATKLPFDDNSFDVVISINTIHNLEELDLSKAIREINRVSKKHSFITVDAYRNNEEKDKIFKWNLTAKTIKSTSEWIKFFKENDYYGDYYWFIP